MTDDARWCSYVDGGWARSGDEADLVDPASEEIFGRVDQADVGMARAAIAAARRAFDDGPWPRMGPDVRAKLLVSLAEAVEARAAELADLERRNVGLTIRTAVAVHIGGGGPALREYARVAAQDFGRALPPTGGPMPSAALVRKEPVGVCAGIIPWNSPFVMAVWKLGPALATGNTVVLKTAPNAPVTPLELAALAGEVGFPPGVVNVLTGGADVGAELAASPDVDKISFTGSTPTGRAIAASAAATVKRVTLELGGKSANLVLDDADLGLAVDGSIWAFLVNQGQACTAGSRLLVAESILEEFLARLTARLDTVRIGPTDDPVSDLGPLISGAHRDRVHDIVTRGLAEGASLVRGGRIPPGLERGFYYAPTVILDREGNTSVSREEIFGPVVTVTPCRSEDEAVRRANDSEFGLAGGVWTRDVARGLAVADRIRAGTVWVNDWHMLSLTAPFGGYKQSGVGREHGAEGYEEYLETKHVHVGLGSVAQRPFGIVLSTPAG